MIILNKFISNIAVLNPKVTMANYTQKLMWEFAITIWDKLYVWLTF